MIFSAAIQEALSGLQNLPSGDRGAHVAALKSYLKDDSPVFDDLRRVSVSDEEKPYGRAVLLETDELEVMVAQWTRNMPCAPHDHGGSLGVVRVLQGRSRHQIVTVDAEGLRVVREEIVGVGETMMCGSDLIHSMEDDGAEEPLVTLHMYTRSIDHMIVYDTGQQETLIVDGTCGAWVPTERPEMIRGRKVGFHHPTTMR